jgi:hypothetical protein
MQQQNKTKQKGTSGVIREFVFVFVPSLSWQMLRSSCENGVAVAITPVLLSLSFLAISRAPKSWCESQNALCEWRRVASCAAEYMSRIVIVVITPVPHFQLSPACNAIAACQDSMPAYQQQYIPHSFFSKKAAGSTSFREFVPSLSWQMVGFQGIRSHKRQSKYRSYL